MPKFRKKPIIVEAEQWFPGKEVEGVKERAKGAYGYIETLEGGHMVDAGDWIITGVAGERYSIKAHIFEATYERVDEEN